jgi:hypothetical protein
MTPRAQSPLPCHHLNQMGKWKEFYNRYWDVFEAVWQTWCTDCDELLHRGVIPPEQHNRRTSRCEGRS